MRRTVSLAGLALLTAACGVTASGDDGAANTTAAAPSSTTTTEPPIDLARLAEDLNIWCSKVGGDEVAVATGESLVIDTKSELSAAWCFSETDCTPGVTAEVCDGRTIESVLTELGFTQATISRISSTRALDGELTATSPDGWTVYWRFHPDNGLDFSIERS